MKKTFGLSSFWLHILAMAFMFIDHYWATIGGNMWMTNVGRIAFPIFAFMIVEGYFHTSNIKRYIVRLLILAVISEIPFNLMAGGTIIFPYHQNVIWTFLIAILCMLVTDKARENNKVVGIIFGILVFGLATVISYLTIVDYFGAGILTVAIFYFFRGKKWWKVLIQIVGLYFINVKLLGGMIIDITLFNKTFEAYQQGLALIAMIPILLYNGELGYHKKWFQYSCYLFYPVHILILSLIALYLV